MTPVTKCHSPCLLVSKTSSFLHTPKSTSSHFWIWEYRCIRVENTDIQWKNMSKMYDSMYWYKSVLTFRAKTTGTVTTLPLSFHKNYTRLQTVQFGLVINQTFYIKKLNTYPKNKFMLNMYPILKIDVEYSTYTIMIFMLNIHPILIFMLNINLFYSNIHVEYSSYSDIMLSFFPVLIFMLNIYPTVLW